MGGKGSGRPPSVKTLINRQKVEKRTPVATELFLPNHSGISVHPEAKDAFGHWSKNSAGNIYNTDLTNWIGIGTNAPAAQLHVESSTSGVGPVMKTTAAGADAKMIFWNVDDLWAIGGFESVNEFEIQHFSGGWQNRFNIDTSGNVTIESGTLDMNSHKIVNVTDPTANQDAATKKYVDDNAFSSPLTTKGDIHVYSTADTRLGVGTNGQVLSADSTETTGLKWITSSGGPDNLTKHFTIEDPTNSEDATMFHFPAAVTITEVVAVVVGSSTPSVTINPKHSTDRSAAGNALLSGAMAITSTSTGHTITNFTSGDNTLPANSYLWLETTAQSGTVDELHLTFTYTED